ncbi:hypothetical protein HRbin06_00809 [archaeon HR06]|nr:hypothetical protein HRbin06_00809 [archaeon HR06]
MKEVNLFQEFREDHRKVRDGLLELASAFEACDLKRAKEILGYLNQILGPHFRFEEEALYPSLKVFLGEYIDKLLKDHDGAIKTAKDLISLIEKGKISKEEGKEAAKITKSLLVHVSDCEGLAIIAERLSKNEIDKITERLLEARREGISLIDWADKIRKR